MDFNYLLPNGRSLTTGKLRSKWTTSVSERSSIFYKGVTITLHISLLIGWHFLMLHYEPILHISGGTAGHPIGGSKGNAGEVHLLWVQILSLSCSSWPKKYTHFGSWHPLRKILALPGHVPHAARQYWDFRDELSTDNGLLLKWLRLVIPHELQEKYLHRLHEGNLSASKVQENA